MRTLFSRPVRRVPLAWVFGLPLLGISWALLWTVRGYWNPLFFFGMWTGAIIVMYTVGDGYPGLRRHLYLAALSIPLWWWFELVNGRVGNWQYVSIVDYGLVQYVLWATLTFSTVVPALDAARGIVRKVVRAGPWRPSLTNRTYLLEAAAGLTAQASVYLIPELLFPLVWVAPFLTMDGLVGLAGGRSLLNDAVSGEWGLLVQVGLAGLLCGFLWEFWNFWAMPKWVYVIPYLDAFRLFEMPLLGYGGYVPFAWSVYQIVALATGRGRLAWDAREAA